MEKPDRFPDVLLLSKGATAPDPLQPLAGAPLIARLMDMARAEGARRFLANAADPKPLLAHFAGYLKISEDDGTSGTGGSLRTAWPMLASDPVLVIATDSIWPGTEDQPLARMRARYEKGAIVLLCVQPGRAHGVRRSHDFCLGPDGRISRDYGAPVLFGGVALIDAAAMALAPEGAFELDALFDAALDEERLFGVVLDAPWYHLGSPDGLAAAESGLTQ